MNARIACSILLVLSACSSSGSQPTTPTTPTTAQRNADLVRQHDEIWHLMELSPAAIEELNGIVVAVNTQMDRNKHDKPAAYTEASAVKRASGELTHADYVANHKKRFDSLGISEPTQKELLAATEFVWRALHDPNVPPEKRKAAETIQAMMKQLNGPPPCCDDNIFVRAAP